MENAIILVPTYKYIEPETEESLKALEARGWKVERRFGYSAVDGARARMATWAFLRGYEWLYWIDSDMQFDVQDFLALANRDEKFCCIPYANKTSGGIIAVKDHFVDAGTRGLVEVQACGFGFVKTHNSIYARMAEVIPVCHQSSDMSDPLIPFFQPRWWKETDGRDVYYQEDFSFCLHARALGFKLYADFDVEIGHIGRWAFRIREPL